MSSRKTDFRTSHRSPQQRSVKLLPIGLRRPVSQCLKTSSRVSVAGRYPLADLSRFAWKFRPEAGKFCATAMAVSVGRAWGTHLNRQWKEPEIELNYQSARELDKMGFARGRSRQPNEPLAHCASEHRGLCLAIQPSRNRIASGSCKCWYGTCMVSGQAFSRGER
jgi:hypothetical protein